MESESVKAMWREYLNTLGEKEEDTTRAYTSWHFCDNEKDANGLVQLVLQGTKRATASLYNSYEWGGEKVPETGDLSIITDWQGTAKCILETSRVSIVPYQEVSGEFAAKEGEGDKSLEYWRGAHWKFFSREMERMDKEPTLDMLVVCEEFQIVYPR